MLLLSLDRKAMLLWRKFWDRRFTVTVTENRKGSASQAWFFRKVAMKQRYIDRKWDNTTILRFNFGPLSDVLLWWWVSAKKLQYLVIMFRYVSDFFAFLKCVSSRIKEMLYSTSETVQFVAIEKRISRLLHDIERLS